jgi:predicted solute-binding protein
MGLKTELYEYARDIQQDYDKEEINQFIEILDEIENEDLSDMSYLSQKLLLRLIDEDDLYEKVNNAKQEPDLDFSDPFE